MRASDRGVHRHRPADLPVPVCRSEQGLVNPVPGAVGREITMPSPHRLPGAELPRQVTPRDPAPVPVDDALHDPPCVRERATLPAGPRRKKRRDQRPLIIREKLETRHPPASHPYTSTFMRHALVAWLHATRNHMLAPASDDPRALFRRARLAPCCHCTTDPPGKSWAVTWWRASTATT